MRATSGWATSVWATTVRATSVRTTSVRATSGRTASVRVTSDDQFVLRTINLYCGLSTKKKHKEEYLENLLSLPCRCRCLHHWVAVVFQFLVAEALKPYINYVQFLSPK